MLSGLKAAALAQKDQQPRDFERLSSPQVVKEKNTHLTANPAAGRHAGLIHEQGQAA
jgi:hypothetical protein